MNEHDTIEHAWKESPLLVTVNTCPFCGGSATLEKKAGKIRILCISCGASIIWCMSTTIAVEKWNKRV